MSEYSLVEIFCKLDDFYEKFEIEFSKKIIEDGSQKSKSGRVSQMCISEVMTIVTLFHVYRFMYFKTFYIKAVQEYLKKYFPKLVSYNRFVELQQKAFIPLYFYNLIDKKT